MVNQAQSSTSAGEQQTVETASDKSPIQFCGRGSSGVVNNSGYMSEEYLLALRGPKAADVWDKMRRSDSKVKKVLKAVKDPIKSATWDIQAAGDTEEQKLHRDFIKHVLFEGMDEDFTFDQFLHEALTSIEFGFAAFEVIHKVTIGHEKFGSFIGLDKFAWRSPRTIEKWNLDTKTERLLSITQVADGDLRRNVDIDAKHLALITLEREGANYEGISQLRPCYGAYSRKQLYLKLLAIGLEKYAIPTPVGTAPVQSGPDYDAFIAALEAYTSHETNYIILPKGWEITLQKTDFDASKVIAAIEHENMEIVDTFIANFLELGMSGGGAYALSNDLSDFFLSGLIAIAKAIEGPANRVIRDLIKINYGPQSKYPTLGASGIDDKAGKELADSLKSLVDGRVVVPDDGLEDNMRSRYGLPKRSNIGQRQAPAQAPIAAATYAAQPVGLSEAAIQLAERNAKKLIASGAADLEAVMKDRLSEMGSALLKSLMKERKAAPANGGLGAVKKVDVAGIRQYKAAIKDVMLEIAVAGLESAKKDVPKARNVKLSEQLSAKSLIQRIEMQAELLANTQADDLYKAVLFQYSSSAPSTDSTGTLEGDLHQALDKYLEGPAIATGASNTAAMVTNVARQEFFADPEVADQIDAFQFVNGDPVSPICQDLAGTVFAKNDPNIDRYMPPLHHNCKSYIMPILSGNLGSRETEALVPSRSSLEKFITLKEPVGKKSA